MTKKIRDDGVNNKYGRLFCQILRLLNRHDPKNEAAPWALRVALLLVTMVEHHDHHNIFDDTEAAMEAAENVIARDFRRHASKRARARRQLTAPPQ
jgi:hypothetical protein